MVPGLGGEGPGLRCDDTDWEEGCVEGTENWEEEGCEGSEDTTED